MSLVTLHNQLRVENLANRLNRSAVTWRDEPFELRGGAYSNWYVDLRAGLSEGEDLGLACKALSGTLRQTGFEEEVVVGIGVGGRMIVNGMRVCHPSLRGAQGNDDRADTTLETGYGFHGTSIEGKKVLAVDEIATSGNSLLTLLGMIAEFGGQVDRVATIADRSHGHVALALAQLGLSYTTLLEFDESAGLLSPVQ
jgi:orotate phosphoribosyltransferase